MSTLTEQLDALEGRVNTIAGGQRTTESELSVVQDDIDDLRNQVSGLERARGRRRRRVGNLSPALGAHPATLGRALDRARRTGQVTALCQLGLEPIERGADLLEALSDGAVGRGDLLPAAPALLFALGLVDLLHRVDDDREQDVDHQERGEQDVGRRSPRRRVDLLAALEVLGPVLEREDLEQAEQRFADVAPLLRILLVEQDPAHHPVDVHEQHRE